MMMYMQSVGNIEFIHSAYEKTKGFIAYEAFYGVMIAIVLFLSFMKLFEEYNKNLSTNKNKIDLGMYWSQIRIYVLVAFFATSSGMVFSLVETLFSDMQTQAINALGADISNRTIDSFKKLIQDQQLAVWEAQEAADYSLFSISSLFDFLGYFLMSIGLAIGFFIFKYTYTFFIIGRYMWLLMLEMVAPVAIVLCLHENTRTYFYNWVKNMFTCYLILPFFLLADCFSNHVAQLTMDGLTKTENAFLGTLTTAILVFAGVIIKIKMFSIVRSKSSQLF